MSSRTIQLFYQEIVIISNISAKCNTPYIPFTKNEIIASYRKKNAGIRHEYYALANAHSHLKKTMLTFTVKGKGTYIKLRLINEIKSYVTYLIANSSADIHFFSNIELGHSFTNPHLHTQTWSDDLEAIQAIYEKIIDKFSLDGSRCSLSVPNQNIDVYHYVMKDYASNLSDDRVYEIERIKKKYRKQLKKKIRFYSRSKSKYQQRLYRIAYKSYGVIRANADKFLDMLTLMFRGCLSDGVKSFSSFITIKNKIDEELFLYFFNAYINALSYSHVNDPPGYALFSSQKILRRSFMFSVCLNLFVYGVEAVACSPPFMRIVLLDIRLSLSRSYGLCLLVLALFRVLALFVWRYAPTRPLDLFCRNIQLLILKNRSSHKSKVGIQN